MVIYPNFFIRKHEPSNKWYAYAGELPNGDDIPLGGKLYNTHEEAEEALYADVHTKRKAKEETARQRRLDHFNAIKS